MLLEIKSHRLDSIEYKASPNKRSGLDPRFLIIHYTASGPAADMAEYFSRKDAGVSAHVVIRRDGGIVQCVPFNQVAYHAGESMWLSKDGKRYSGLNAYSIGVEIENWGPLRRGGLGWISWTGATVENVRVIEARHKFGAPDCGWEAFTEGQVAAALEVARAVTQTYNIDEILGHDDVSPGRKSDPGPAWIMNSFTAKVFGRSEGGDGTMVVRSANGLNLRVGPSAAHALAKPKPLPDGTSVMVHEADGKWRFVSVLDRDADPQFSGWVHGDYLRVR